VKKSTIRISTKKMKKQKSGPASGFGVTVPDECQASHRVVVPILLTSVLPQFSDSLEISA